MCRWPSTKMSASVIVGVGGGPVATVNEDSSSTILPVSSMVT